jgi:hypothetical protein
MSPSTYDRVIITTMGYTQGLGYRTGLEILDEKICEELGSTNCRILTPVRWDRPAEDIAAWVRRNTHSDARIDVTAYSYGGGVWFPKFEKAMEGRPLHTINLIDPVPRFRPFAILGSWFGRFKVPIRSGARVTVYMQDVNFPRSPGVRPGPHVNPVIVPTRIKHSDIDNDPAIHDRILESLRETRV